MNEKALRQKDSWSRNADAWTQVVREGGIESRRAATDRAILDAITESAPSTMLDVGCGEGWLVRAAAERGIDATGIDGSPELIASARAAGGGRFEVISYEDLVSRPERVGASFDLVVCNFALLDEELRPLLKAIRSIAASMFIIQTVHPWTAKGDLPYENAWRTERFDAFGGEFAEEMPWFFRTLESWVADIRQAGFAIRQIREPAHPESGVPLSLLFVCR